ncbi:hypothetical protein Tco_1067034 [Tanacetum coccineum]|uniref:Uncharacterized protein n=1 Tax=Tanacetum coccineum TaxID=301880 RepID=A0ABQ5HDE8_9ASTR
MLAHPEFPCSKPSEFNQLNRSSTAHEDLHKSNPEDNKRGIEMANGHDILLWSTELQEIKTTRTRKLKKECACGINYFTLLVSCDGLGGYDWSDQAEEGPNYALMAFSSLSPDSEEKYNAFPPPYIGNFMLPTPDLSFTGLDEFVNEPVVKNSKAMSSEEEPKVVRKNDDAPIIEE